MLGDMDFVITLIADPSKAPLTQAFVDSMTPSLGLQAIPVQKTQWLKEGVACDLFTAHASRDGLDGFVQSVIADQPYDAVVQPAANRRKKLLVADMESTIITCECLDELAEYVGLREKIEAITARAMNGELDFAQALKERVALLAGLTESALQEVYDKKAQLMPGAKELVAVMKKAGATCMLVSGGFDYYTTRIKSRLGFDEERSNRLEIVDGRLTGRVIPPILGKEAKLAALEEGCSKLGIAPQDALAVGDGANDLPMLLEAGLGVAFRAKPAVRAAARARVNHGDLTALLFAQGYAFA
jgi:phosphoserine phosphatase